MSDQLHVAFGDHQVTVRVDDPTLLDDLRPDLEPMLVAKPVQTIGRLTVQRTAAGYRLSGAIEADSRTVSRAQVLDHLRYEIPLQLIHARPDLLWLHAGAAAAQEQAVMVSGASGRGKSTLITALCRHGWQYLSDDILPLDPQTQQVFPFPQRPMVRQNQGRLLPEEQLQALPKLAMPLPEQQIRRRAVPLLALVFPVYRPGAGAALEPCSPATATLELLQNALNFIVHREQAVQTLCALLQRLPAYYLVFGDGGQAAKAIIRAIASGQLGSIKTASSFQGTVSIGCY